MGVTILNRVVKVGLIEKVILEQRLESKGGSEVRKGTRVFGGRASPKALCHGCAQLFQEQQAGGFSRSREDKVRIEVRGRSSRAFSLSEMRNHRQVLSRVGT